MKLYEIADEIRRILDATEETQGELTDDQVAELDRLVMAFEEKVENVAFVIREMEADAHALQAEAKRLSQKAQVRENRARELKRYLLDHMRAQGLRKVKGRLLSVRIQKSAPSVEIVSEPAIPKRFWRQPPPVLDRRAILDALKAGDEVPDAAIRRNEHIRIT